MHPHGIPKRPFPLAGPVVLRRQSLHTLSSQPLNCWGQAAECVRNHTQRHIHIHTSTSHTRSRTGAVYVLFKLVFYEVSNYSISVCRISPNRSVEVSYR